MFEELRGKRLLLLSCTTLMCQVVQVAKSLGIHTIVTDYNLDYSKAPAKLIADEAWDISWSDIPVLAEKCREAGVDGVFTGFSEFCVIAARKLCDELGFPFYATLEQIELTRDKNKFKEFCAEQGAQVTEKVNISGIPSQEQLSEVEYPVIIKPADNAGSRGISVCYNEEDLLNGIKKALSFSGSKTYSVEKYISGTEVNAYYTLQDGKISLSCMSDAVLGYQGKNQIKLMDGWLYPSKYLGKFLKTADKDCRKVLQSLGAENGTFQFATIYDGRVFRIFEAGYRLGGGTNYRQVAARNEIDYLKMMIAHSLTGKMSGWDVFKYDDPHFLRPGCNLEIFSKPGIIWRTGNIDRIREMEGVLSVDQYYHEGQEVPDSGAMNQTFMRVNVIADNAEDLAAMIGEIYTIVDLQDVNGNNMILSRIDLEKLKHYWE